MYDKFFSVMFYVHSVTLGFTLWTLEYFIKAGIELNSNFKHEERRAVLYLHKISVLYK